MEYTDVHVADQTRATRALLKFCDDHHYKTQWLSKIKECLRHLEAGRVADAYQVFETVPFGGMGTFNDWFPPAVFSHEDEEYSWTVFEALCANWTRMMRLAKRE